MNILLITPFYYIEGRPELFHDTSVIHYFTKYWVKENNVYVFNVYPNSYKSVKRYIRAEQRHYYKTGYQFEADGVKVFLTEVQKFPGQNGKYTSWQLAHVVKQFSEWHKKEKIQLDVIIAHVPSYAIDIVKKIKHIVGRDDIPTIGVLHFTDIEEMDRRSDLSYQLDNIFDVIYARSNGIFNKASKYGLQHLQKEIVQSGIPVSKNRNLIAPTAIQNGLKLIYVGKLIHRKHLDVVLKAIPEIGINVSIDVVGEGEEEKKLKKLVVELELESKVHFLGKLSRENVLVKMSQANMFCMPSVNETLGLTYIEAMSVGCVPIGTRGEGIDGVIIDGVNGYLVNADTMQSDLVGVIHKYINMTDAERNVISKAGIETAMKLEESICAENYLNMVKRSIK